MRAGYYTQAIGAFKGERVICATCEPCQGARAIVRADLDKETMRGKPIKPCDLCGRDLGEERGRDMSQAMEMAIRFFRSDLRRERERQADRRHDVAQ